MQFYQEKVISGLKRLIQKRNKKDLNAMPQKYKTNKMIRPVGEAHNPLKEYKGILNYLGNNTVPFLNIDVGYDVQNLIEITKSLKIDSNVEILMVEIYNGKNGPGDSGKGGNEWERKEVLELDDGRKFALDSAIVEIQKINTFVV